MNFLDYVYDLDFFRGGVMPKRESQTIEYKSSWHDDYYGWIAGYANAHGGTLYIGVNDDGYVIGVKDIHFLLDILPNNVNSHLGITVSIDHNTVQGLGNNLRYDEVPVDIAMKPENLYVRGLLDEDALIEIDENPSDTKNVSAKVIKLYEAAPGFVKQLRKSKTYRDKIKENLHRWKVENPVYMDKKDSLEYAWIIVEPFPYGVPYHGRYWTRSGGTTHEIKDAQLSKFLYDKVGKKWDALPVKRADIKRVALDYLRSNAVEKGRLTQEAAGVSDNLLIENLRMLTEDGDLTRAAAMLFSDPEAVVFGAFIHIGFFVPGESKDTYRLAYQDEIHGPLISQPERAVDLIFTKYMKALVDIEGLHRTETYMTTRKILREVILNAIAHKFYPSCVPIKVKVFEDHITVKNEGFWPFEDLKVEDAYKGEHSTYQTNPLIDHGLYMSGVMDTWGQGFGLIRDECEKTNAPLPDIKATEKTVTVTIYASMKYAELLKNISSSTEGIPPVIPPVKVEIPPVTPPVKKNKSAEAIQESIISFCEENSRGILEIAEWLGYKDKKTVHKYLDPLIKQGKITMTIPDKPNSSKQRYIRG